MSVRAAFGKTRPLMARYDVSPHLVKLWKTHKHTDGQVIRQLSPYEQKVIQPWAAHLPKEILWRVTEGAWDILPALAALYGVVTWGKWYYADICHHHRD